MSVITSDIGDFDLKQAEEQTSIALAGQQNALGNQMAAAGITSKFGPDTGQSGATDITPQSDNSGLALVAGLVDSGIAMTTGITVPLASMAVEAITAKSNSATNDFSQKFAERTKGKKGVSAFDIVFNRADSKQERMRNQGNAKAKSATPKTKFGSFTAGYELQKKTANDDFSSAFQIARQDVGDTPKGMSITPQAMQQSQQFILQLKTDLASIQRKREQGPDIVADALIQKNEVGNAAKRGEQVLQDRLQDHAQQASVKIMSPTTSS